MSDMSTIARRYASAIVQLAEKENSFEDWQTNLGHLQQIVADSDLDKFLQHPAITNKNKSEVVEEVAQKFQGQFRSFVITLAKAKRIAIVEKIKKYFEHMLVDKRKHLAVGIRTAFELSDVQKSKITEKLEKKYSATVSLEQTLDPSLLAGAVISIDDYVINYSLQNQLQRLNAHLMK